MQQCMPLLVGKTFYMFLYDSMAYPGDAPTYILY